MKVFGSVDDALAAIGGVTAVAAAHTEAFGGLEGVAAAKGELDPIALDRLGHSLVNHCLERFEHLVNPALEQSLGLSSAVPG